MSPEETTNLWNDINKTKELFIKRNSSHDWQRNIVDGSKTLKTKTEWANFYAWLSNPNHFVVKQEETDFNFDEEDDELWKSYKYPEGIYEKRYKNGNETVIHIVNKNLYPDQNDEKDEKQL